MQGWLFYASDYWMDAKRVESFITSVPLVCLQINISGVGGGYYFTINFIQILRFMGVEFLPLKNKVMQIYKLE